MHSPFLIRTLNLGNKTMDQTKDDGCDKSCDVMPHSGIEQQHKCWTDSAPVMMSGPPPAMQVYQKDSSSVICRYESSARSTCLCSTSLGRTTMHQDELRCPTVLDDLTQLRLSLA